MLLVISRRDSYARPAVTTLGSFGMKTHRLLEQLGERDTASLQPTGLSMAGFMVYPLVCCPAFAGPLAVWQQQLYQLAFEQAQAATHGPALRERDFFSVWN
jgi:hypothetical protein